VDSNYDITGGDDDLFKENVDVEDDEDVKKDTANASTMKGNVNEKSKISIVKGNEKVCKKRIQRDIIYGDHTMRMIHLHRD
jgi:hypothetical protein